MKRRILFWLSLIFFAATACRAGKPVPPAQAEMTAAWRAPRRVTWQLEWPNAPVGGPVTAVVWRYGPHLRVEILEAPAPALVGQTLIVNRGTTWQFNRFDTQPSLVSGLPSLPPVTDAFVVVDRLIAARPVSANRWVAATLQYNPAEKFEAHYPGSDRLTFWLDRQTGLPVHIIVLTHNQKIELKARHIEPLSAPPEDLFAPP